MIYGMNPDIKPGRVENRGMALFSRTRKGCNEEVSEEFLLFHQDVSLEHEEEKRNIDFRNGPA